MASQIFMRKYLIPTSNWAKRNKILNSIFGICNITVAALFHTGHPWRYSWFTRPLHGSHVQWCSQVTFMEHFQPSLT